MRFYWGLGVGHVYSHGCTDTGALDDEEGAEESDAEQPTVPCDNVATIHLQEDYEGDQDEDPEPEVVAELGLDDREKDILTDSDDDEGDADGCGVEDSDSSGGEEELELEDTYNGKY